MAQLAVKMDMDRQDKKNSSIMEFEYAYIDGIHSHATGYKTLTLQRYSPSMYKILSLAAMKYE